MLVPAMERLHYIDELSMFLAMLVQVMERLHCIGVLSMFLGSVGAGDGKTTLYR